MKYNRNCNKVYYDSHPKLIKLCVVILLDVEILLFDEPPEVINPINCLRVAERQQPSTLRAAALLNPNEYEVVDAVYDYVDNQPNHDGNNDGFYTEIEVDSSPRPQFIPKTAPPIIPRKKSITNVPADGYVAPNVVDMTYGDADGEYDYEQINENATFNTHRTPQPTNLHSNQLNDDGDNDGGTYSTVVYQPPTSLNRPITNKPTPSIISWKKSIANVSEDDECLYQDVIIHKSHKQYSRSTFEAITGTSTEVVQIMEVNPLVNQAHPSQSSSTLRTSSTHPLPLTDEYEVVDDIDDDAEDILTYEYVYGRQKQSLATEHSISLPANDIKKPVLLPRQSPTRSCPSRPPPLPPTMVRYHSRNKLEVKYGQPKLLLDQCSLDKFYRFMINQPTYKTNNRILTVTKSCRQ